jgi:hypothetical protein
MQKNRTRMSGHLPKGTARIEAADRDYYGFFVKMTDMRDRTNLRKAIEKLNNELGMMPSNPMLLSCLLRKYVEGK